MSKGLRATLLTIGGIVAVAAVLLIGMNIGRAAVFSSNVWADGFSILRADRDYPYSGSMMDSLALDFHKGNSMLVSGMMGMMGGFNFPSEESMLEMMGGPADAVDIGDLPVGPQEAVEVAQKYLDANLPGAEAEDSPDSFYGYYTLHIERDGEVVGMLSVNGETGQVWPHTWHGELIEMSDHE